MPAGQRHSTTFVDDFRNGDFLLTHANWRVNSETGETMKPVTWGRMEFFGGNYRAIKVDEANRLGKLYKPAPSFGLLSSDLLRLPLGHSVKMGSREFGGANCGVNYSSTMNLLNRDDKIVTTRMVMWLREKPMRRPYWPYCSPDGNPDHYLSKVEAIFFFHYPLRDNTFLASSFSHPFVIRFRPDLTSPFIDEHPNLFLVETAIIDRIVGRAYKRPGFRVQNAIDALEQYLFKLQRKKERTK